MSEIDYVKILRAYISEVAHMEGTDFLGSKGDQCLLMDLDEAENAELTRIRDEVRAEDGWPGYVPATPQGEH